MTKYSSSELALIEQAARLHPHSINPPKFFLFPLNIHRETKWQQIVDELVACLGYPLLDSWEVVVQHLPRPRHFVAGPVGAYKPDMAYRAFLGDMPTSVPAAKAWLRYRKINTSWVVWRSALDPFDPQGRLYCLIEFPRYFLAPAR